VIAPGVAVYLAWFVWARYLSPDLIFFEEPLSIANVSFLPESLVQIPSAALAAATGTFYRLNAVGALDFNIGPGYVLLALALTGCFVLWRKSGVGVFQRALVPASMLLVFAFLVAFGMSDPARQPTSPRYIYFTVLCVLWIFCELTPAIRWRPWGYGALVAVLGAGVLANANIYGKAASSLRDAGARSRAAITALEIAGPAATPWLRISAVAQGTGADGAFSEWIVRLDRESIARFGVASYSPVELRAVGPQTQATTDRILLGVERIRLRSLDSSLPTPRCSAPTVVSSAPLLERVEVQPGESLSIEAGRATGHSVINGCQISLRSAGHVIRALGAAFDLERIHPDFHQTLHVLDGAQVFGIHDVGAVFVVAAVDPNFLDEHRCRIDVFLLVLDPPCGRCVPHPLPAVFPRDPPRI
jgi:hypothetical protein